MANTEAELVARRESAMDRADAALDKAWPERQGDAYSNAMRAELRELESIVASMQQTGLGPTIVGRTWRYIGSVRADLAPALGDDWLASAIDAYDQAEHYLRGQDDLLERAKLNFNLANAQRQHFKNDVAKLEEAERRLLAARSTFQEHTPEYLPTVDEAVQSTRSLIQLAVMSQQVDQDRSRVDALGKQIESGGDASEIAREFDAIKNRDGGPLAQVINLQKLIGKLPDSAKKGSQFDELQKMVGAFTSMATDMESTKDPEHSQALDLLRDKLGEEVRDGKVSANKAEALGDLLDQLGMSLGGGDDIQSLMKKVGNVQAKATTYLEMNHYLSHGIERPPPGSRAAELVETLWLVRRFMLEEMSARNKSDEESKLALNLNIRGSKIDKRIYEAGDDDTKATLVNNEFIRPYQLEARTFAARHHPMLVHPVWRVADTPATANALLFAGPDSGRQLAAKVCRRLALDLLKPATGQSVAAARFRQIQKAFVAVFDLRAEQASKRAAVAYELGIARVLSKPIVVIAAPGQKIPFDIDIEPLLLGGDASDEDELHAAIDRAAAWAMPRPTGSDHSIAATVDEVLRQYPLPQDDVYINQTLKLLDSARDDPVTVNAALSSLVTYLPDSGVRIINTVWPPAYRKPGVRQLFHVMPFGPDWADDAADCAEAVCDKKGVRYVRGDRVSEANVIHSIWEEINLASHVLVDLTGFNENVAIELGMTQLLGRPSLTVGQAGTVDELFPMIAKQRFYEYGAPLDGRLAAHVERLLKKPTRR